MTRILEVSDRTGRNIYLTDERYGHIKKHPDMQNSISLIERTIRSPQRIADYPIEPEIKYFYSYHKNRKSKAKYLRVIVKYLNGEGFVVTAYFVEKML